MEFEHVPVLYDEVMQALNIQPDGIYVDGTVGGGGHSSGICERLSREGTLIAVDRDNEALEAARARLAGYECNKKFIHANYSDTDVIAEAAGGKVQGILLDLGVSSYQLDNAERGFSYMQDAPMDMRMNEDDILTAYDVRDGKQLWQFRTKARIVGTPAAAGGIVVTGSADHCIYGLSAKTGKLLWKVECEAPVLGAVTIQGSRCYVGASDHKMRCIALKTGQVVWTLDGVEGYIETKPLVTKQHVVFGAWDNHLYSANTQDGTLQWKWKVEKGSTHYSPAAVWPVEAAGKVFVTDPDRAMSAIDAQTGKTVWRTKQSMVRETIGLSKDKKRVYSKTMNDSIVCYLTEGSQPIELWATAVGFGYEHAPSMPVEHDGIVYGSTKEGMIFALEAKKGQLLWRHKIGNSLISTVVPIGKHRILFTSSDGVIGMLEEK